MLDVEVSIKTGVPSVKNTVGTYKHSIYRNFYLMHYRVINHKNFNCYKGYQKKGITICPEWSDFDKFIEDMYPTYKENLVLDRVDNTKGYYKENCQWLTIGQNFAKELVKPIYEYSLTGELLRLHESRTEAAILCNGAANSLSRANLLMVPYRGKRWSDLECINGLPKELQNKINSVNVPIRQIDPITLEVIKVWDSSKEACEALNISNASISQVANEDNARLTTGGFRWSYAIDINTGTIPVISNTVDRGFVSVIQLEVTQIANVVNVFMSPKEAAKLTDFTASKINRALKKEGSTYLGFGWKINNIGLLEQIEYTKQYKELKEFATVAEAGKAVNVSASNITAVCRGKKASAGGFEWKYR